jgi:hypothetical protein
VVLTVSDAARRKSSSFSLPQPRALLFPGISKLGGQDGGAITRSRWSCSPDRSSTGAVRI